jgi:hypothetical protein
MVGKSSQRGKLTEAILLILLASSMPLGCGSTKQNVATEQLLMSNAVDATVAKLDFTPLALRKVYLDTTYVNKPAMVASASPQPIAIDSNYLISSVRQKMFASGVFLVDTKEEADIIAEPRVGALGMDGHDVTYGMPASSALSSATSAVAGAPLIPAIPEISVARKEDRAGRAKLAVFAYDRKTRQPFWQSGVARSNSDSKATWVLGVGPFQRGSIRGGTEFAGSRVASSTLPAIQDHESLEEYLSSRTFESQSPSVKHAGHEESSSAAGQSPVSGTVQSNGPAGSAGASPPATPAANSTAGTPANAPTVK